MHDAVALLTGQQTYDSQVAGSSPGWASLRSGLGQTTYTCVPLSPSSIILYQPRECDLSGWESNHRPGGKQWQPNTGFMTESPTHLWADCQDTRISSEPNTQSIMGQLYFYLCNRSRYQYVITYVRRSERPDRLTSLSE